MRTTVAIVVLVAALLLVFPAVGQADHRDVRQRPPMFETKVVYLRGGFTVVSVDYGGVYVQRDTSVLTKRRVIRQR